MEALLIANICISKQEIITALPNSGSAKAKADSS